MVAWIRSCAWAPLLLCGSAHQQARPDIRFGLIADVQYADKPKAGARRYRESLAKLRAAVAELNRERPRFVVNLGDSIDGNGDRSTSELDLVAAEFRGSRAPVQHVIGNHCLAAPRNDLMRSLRMRRSYVSFGRGRWSFIVLDGMDVSKGTATSPAGEVLAADMLRRDPRLPTYNGAVGPEQLAWLEAQLSAAKRGKRRVVVFCHHPVEASAADRATLLWNADDVRRIIERSGVVVAYFSGHHHAGGYALVNGVHHVTVQGMVEAPTSSNAYAVVDVHSDHLEVRGFGTVPSRTLDFAP